MAECEDIFDSENEELVRQYAAKLMARRNVLLESVSEDELIAMTTQKTMVIHFFKDGFQKCEIMNEALRQLAIKHPEIRFVYVRVENAPKMCASLKIVVLPFVGFFKDGYFVDELVGFEKLGNKEKISCNDLEKYLKNNGFLEGSSA